MNWRKLHRIVGLIVLIPLTIVTITGLVLQLRNQFESIQPTTIKNKLSGAPVLTHEKVIETFGEKNVEQIIYKPSKGSLVVRLIDGNEVQLHPETGEVLKKAMRRTSFLIDLHQGSWFGKFGQYGIFFISGLGLFYLIISGVIIYPFKRKRYV